MSARVFQFIAPDRRQRIFQLALPIIAGMVSQNVLNLVDTAMVGKLGNDALAAVGISSFANFMAMAFITGLSAGVQAMVARRLGEERHGEVAIPLNGGLLLVLCLAIPWSILLFFLAPWFFPFLNNQPQVMALGVPYLQARLLSITGIGMNFSFRGYWNGVNLSHLYMKTLLVIHGSNIFLNWVLIYGNLGAPAMGTTGAGISSAIAVYLGTICYIILGLRYARQGGFLKTFPDRATMKSMLKISLPSGLQQFLFAAGSTVFLWIIGRLGTAELAASNVLLNLLMVSILPSIGFGLAAATLVGQALGRQNPTDAKAWGWDVVKLSMLWTAVISIPAICVPDVFLKPFLHHEETLALARLPLRIVAGGLVIDTMGLVLLNALLGAGDSKRVMKVSFSLQWLLFLPIAYLIGPVWGMGLLAVWLAQMLYRSTQSLIFAWIWHQGQWATQRV